MSQKSITWKPSQLSAIETRDKTLLVSAAAGSGKTATLTECIIRSLTDDKAPTNISDLLVVTFTRASADDLKTKISRAISKALAADPTNRHLAKQLTLLGSAKISTIDSFYFDVVKNNFQKINLYGNAVPCDLRIADSAEAKIMNKRVMEALVNDLYNRDATFPDLVEHFTTLRNRSKISDVLLNLYGKLMSYKDGVKLLDTYANRLDVAAKRDFFETVYGQCAKNESLTTLKYIINVLSAACEHLACDPTLSSNYLPAFKNDLNTATALKELILENKYNDAKAVLDDYQKLSLKAVKKADETTVKFREMRKKITLMLEKLRQKYFSTEQSEISKLMSLTASVCRKLYSTLREFDERILGEKLSAGLCEFNDIRRFVLSLMIDENGEPTPLALDYRDRFDRIYIDEYQDVDEVQDMIFRAISRDNNRFMVGDIKQSIYSFRGAEPSIFAGYKKTMPVLDGENKNESDCFSIFMSENFRCDKNVVDFTNLVSSYLFSNRSESIEYTHADDLIFSKALPSHDYASPKATVAIVEIPTKRRSSATDPEESEDADTESGNSDDADKNADTEEKVNFEALYIANEIKRLISHEKKADGTPIAPRDIAILMRSKTDVPEISAFLSSLGIPFQSPEEKSFFENSDVLLMLALLSTIDNPERDISLAGTLRSPLFNFTIDDITKIRLNAEHSVSLYGALKMTAEEDSELGNKCRGFKQELDRLRALAASLPVDKLIRRIYHDMSVLAYTNGSDENLLKLYEYARSFESGGFRGLYRFIRYINEIIDSKETLSEKSTDASANAVQIMSIHHSKGLEFPVCFIYGTGKQFNKKDTQEKIQFESSVGMGFCLHDESGFAYTDTPVRQAIINKKDELRTEEEMRVLYVAMTRARERLYVTAKVTNVASKRDNAENIAEFGADFGIINASCYLDWILAAIKCDKTGNDSFVVRELTANDIIENVECSEDSKDSTTVNNTSENTPLPDPSEDEFIETLKERFLYKYPFEHVFSLPAKLSVSKLYPEVLDGNETNTDLLDINTADNTAESTEASTEDFALPDNLLDIKKATAADRGTATHAFLQFCDFDLVVAHGVDSEIRRLKEQRFIAPNLSELVNKKQLERFFSSELFKRIRNAKRVYREQRFNIFLPASQFTSDEEKKELLKEETIAVQGVIDIFFEEVNGDIVLCDYKTDFLTADELNNRELAGKKLSDRHAQQLGYYSDAISIICGRRPSKTLIYSLPLGDSIEI